MTSVIMMMLDVVQSSEVGALKNMLEAANKQIDQYISSYELQ